MPILLSRTGNRMDRHAATRLRALARQAGVQLPRMHPHMLRHTYVTTMLDSGVPLRDVQIAARHADPRTTVRHDRARKNLDTPTTPRLPIWPPELDQSPRVHSLALRHGARDGGLARLAVVRATA